MTEDLEALAARVDALGRRVDALGERILTRIDALPFLREDVYEARHAALRAEIELRMAAMKADTDAARALSLWAVGLVVTLVIGAVISWL